MNDTPKTTMTFAFLYCEGLAGSLQSQINAERAKSTSDPFFDAEISEMQINNLKILQNMNEQKQYVNGVIYNTADSRFEGMHKYKPTDILIATVECKVNQVFAELGMPFADITKPVGEIVMHQTLPIV